MREIIHGSRLGRMAVAAITLGAMVGSAGPVAAAPVTGLDGIRACPPGSPGLITAGPRVPRLRLTGRLDAAGAVVGTSVRLGGRPFLRLGIGGFADGPFDGQAIVGERVGEASRLVILDPWRRCALRRLVVPGLVYGSRVDTLTGLVHVSLVEPVTRLELGIWTVDPDAPEQPWLAVAPPTGIWATAPGRTGELDWDGGPVGRWCAEGTCQERTALGRSRILRAEPDLDGDGGTPFPLLAIRPVPEEPAPRWPQNAVLRYRWHGGDTPPSWMRPAINAAAEDVSQTRRSRTPTFRYDADASDTFRYTGSMPSSGCATSIACASYEIDVSWTVRFRPHGWDFRWGTLRWCQADDRDGCFDVERVALHELGHIVGIDHPESAGFSLRPTDTVMTSLTPSKPRSGWSLHGYAPCDVATLQMRYDTLTPSTLISTCADVGTALTLSASSVAVPRYSLVTLVAELRIPDRDAYRRLGGNPLSDRGVQLRRRPLTSPSGAWSVFWMRPGDSPGQYLLSLQPSVGYEFQAVFPAPAAEGLGGSSSGIVSVRVIDGCGPMPCVQTEDPMS